VNGEALAELAATFGAPSALLIWMWINRTKQTSGPRDVTNELITKLDAIENKLDVQGNRITRVEVILEERHR